jgi:lipoprotein signal peptidase
MELRNHPEGAPSLGWMVLAVFVIGAGNLVSWFPFGLACAIGETEGTALGRICGDIGWFWLFGPLAVVAGAMLGRITDRRWPFGAGAVVGIVVAIAPWFLFGDPAGNFGGVLDA